MVKIYKREKLKVKDFNKMLHNNDVLGCRIIIDVLTKAEYYLTDTFSSPKDLLKRDFIMM